MPSRPPIPSARISRPSALRPSEANISCRYSMKAPKPILSIIMNARQENFRFGRAQSHKKLKPPKKTKCTHLSTSGTFTSGISFAGMRHRNKMSKVHRIAASLALFLYGDDAVNNCHICLMRLRALRMQQHPAGRLRLKDYRSSFLPSSLCHTDPGLHIQDLIPDLDLLL